MGAMAIQKQAAFDLGSQVERLAGAVTSRDVEHLLELATELGELGRNLNFDGIETAAEKLRVGAVNEDTQWVSLIRETYDLMDLCRSTQSEFLQSLLEAEGLHVNDGREPAGEVQRGENTRASSR